jgi:hypothetical protein
MRYVRNIEKEQMSEAVIRDVVPTKTEKKEEEYFSPALQDTSSKVVASTFSPSVSKPPSTPSPRPRAQYPSKPVTRTASSLSKEEQVKIREKIPNTDVSDSYKRTNLILGHTLLAAVSKIAKVFGEEVEETDWEPVKKVPKDMIELDNHVLRIYFNKEKGIVEAVEILEKEGEPKSGPKKASTAKSPLTPMPDKPKSMPTTSTNFNSMTVKDLKSYAEDKKIDLPTNARKADIVEILENSSKNNPSSRRQLPKIPSSED